jgi:NADH-quinone oxidoreductase subunit N
MAVLLFSLIGIPPLGGFFGKFYVFSAAIEAKLFLLAIIGILASVVSAFYYLRLVKIMYFDAPVGRLAAPGPEIRGLFWTSALFLAAFPLIAEPVRRMAELAASALIP